MQHIVILTYAVVRHCWGGEMTTFIPDYQAKVTNKALLRKTLKKERNQGIRNALHSFSAFSKSNLKRVTFDLVNKDVITFDATCDEEILRKYKRISCRIFTLGDGYKRILSKTKKLKVCSVPKVDTVRDLLCYDGTDYDSGVLVSSILIVCECIRVDAVQDKEETEFVTTIYKVQSTEILQSILNSLDNYHSSVLENLKDNLWMNRGRWGAGFISFPKQSAGKDAESVRRKQKK